ncbi:MAG TPA: MaoC family dehydratase N-terminal domain-containing protein [Acidimicrobiales bacterium]|nr:MaoC family dehydratase N-terminal domain-containing protein [Acidimicrobiales bacterium]
MTVDRSMIGRSTGEVRVVVERAPVAVFADAVKDDNPIYRDPAVADRAGLRAIPVPPTFPFVMEHWGRFPELQPETGSSETPSPVAAILGPLLARGGVLLHGEQEFAYERAVFVGDILRGEGRVVDVYEKESNGHAMTFVVVETRWGDDRTGDPVVTVRMNLIHRI